MFSFEYQAHAEAEGAGDLNTANLFDTKNNENESIPTMGAGTAFMKYSLFAFNFLCVFGGISIITLGTFYFTDFDKYLDFTFDKGDKDDVIASSYKAPAILLIVIGSLVALIAFFGCWGTLREDDCMMLIYTSVLGFILLTEISVGVMAVVCKDEFQQILKNGFEKSMKKYGAGSESLTKSWDTMQRNVECCGTESYADWRNTTWTQNPANLIPISCCSHEPVEGCSKNMIDAPPEIAKNTIYIDGCLSRVMSSSGLYWLIGTSTFVGIIELLGIIFGCHLASNFKNPKFKYIHFGEPEE